MTALHPNIVSYIRQMKSTSYWYADDEPKTIWNRVKRFYLHARLLFLLVLFIQNAIGLYYLEGFGLLDGSFIYSPICLFLTVVNWLAYWSRKDLERLISALNQHFIANNEPWMEVVSEKHIKPLWRNVKFLLLYDKAVIVFYMVTPFLADCILHYGFDVLENPFFLPTIISPWLPPNVTWSPKYYLVIVLSWWSFLECIRGIFGFLINYMALTTFVHIQMVILKESVRSARFDGSKKEIDTQFKALIARHNDNIRLNKHLKAVLGLPSAIQSQVQSLMLTLTVFTSVTASGIPVRVAYASGSFFYLGSGLLYSVLGQRLEDESNDIFQAFYNLPWYKCTPRVRTNLNMIMRQTHRNMVIDFHGRSKMNLANFMQVLRQSYSYFTLLQSVLE